MVIRVIIRIIYTIAIKMMINDDDDDHIDVDGDDGVRYNDS